ncbi:MAG: NADH-quinone oxidoreductase subunit NuoG [Alphaproteobacteria bacterium]|jgi:NADH-quinone oxidoreductase subunit G|nr:NADH-quinone oxidoreductase subunit NuoG [Alphaproteobacteria bacterium]
MATVFIDGKPYEVDPSRNMLQVALELGFDLPYFCWHPALGSVGACRQCAVSQYKDADDTAGKLGMACMTAAGEGTRIGIESEEAREFRKSVIEWLMIAHPHDCPVCEEGGECHLQDMTVMAGHAYRRYRYGKRTHRNQDLGPFIGHEMNRCIACYRCVRFYKEYAGGRDLDAFATARDVYFGRSADGVLESPFSGNLAEICPTGVFTDKTLGEAYTRKWDMASAPSVCGHCSLGCNTFVNERYGAVRRILNRYNHAINGYFLCDRGRFGYGFANREDRPTTPLLRRVRGGAPSPASATEVAGYLGTWLAEPSGVIGLGSPRASLESNFALQTAVGAERFYHAVPEAERALVATVLGLMRGGPVPTASLREAEDADAVLVLGEDVGNTAPRLALSLRQSVRHAAWRVADKAGVPRWQDNGVREAAHLARSPLVLATPEAGDLEDVALASLCGTPDRLARFGCAVAHAIDGGLPEAAVPDAVRTLAARTAEALLAADRPLVVSGTGCLSEAVVRAAAMIAGALHRRNAATKQLFVLPQANSAGLALLESAGGVEAALARARAGDIHTVVVMEADPDRVADPAAVDEALSDVRHVVVLDPLPTGFAARRADLVLPAASFADAAGTVVNHEGRAQRFAAVRPPPGDVQASWRWLRDALARGGRSEAAGWQRLDDLTLALAARGGDLTGLEHVAPPAEARHAGRPLPREPHRASGRTAVHAGKTMFEPAAPPDPDTPLRHSMEGHYAPGRVPPALLPFLWQPGWDSEQALNKFQAEITGPLKGGDRSVRLLAPDPDAPAPICDPPPPEPGPADGTWPDPADGSWPGPADGTWPVVPVWRVFGSEELSTAAPAIRARMTPPHLLVHPADAEHLGLRPGAPLTLTVEGRRLTLPIALSETIPEGTIGLPAGFPETAGFPIAGATTAR